MIDPTDVTDYNRTRAQLEEFWLFCLVVAGKTAVVQAKLLDGFLTRNQLHPAETPFETLRGLVERDQLLEALKESRLGQYTRLERAMRLSLALDPETCSVGDLEAIPGVGSKTARFYVLHSRANQRLAVLDTHVLRYMRDLGLTTQKGSPPKGAKYDGLEQQFLSLADNSGQSPADFDLMIWNRYARKA